MKALILNSGIGKRMGELTSARCKCMVEIADGITILDIQMTGLIKCGITEVCVTTGPFADDIEAYLREKYTNVHFTFVNNPVYDKTNYIYSICLAKDVLQDDDILLLHGDIVFELNVMQDVITAKQSVMVTDSTKQLPEKDFKAVVQDNKIVRVGIDEFDEAYYAQPMYKLLKKDWLIWLNEISRFCAEGTRGVYAENAFNCVSSNMNVCPLDIQGRICFEVDNQEDLKYAKETYRKMTEKKQIIYDGYDSYLKIKDIQAVTEAKKIMVVCDSGFEKFSVPVKKLIESMSGNIIYFKDFSPNPDFSDIIKGVSLFTEEACDFIISTGGGSAIDTAKCINILAEDTHLTLLNEARCQHLAIPTTAGTGSESTHFAVLYQNRKKQSVEHESILPDYVILDPGFLETLPEYQKKSTMLDALCQSIESVWAKGATSESKGYALKAIRIILENIDAYLDGDSKSMNLMMQAANLSGKAINISKTTAAHAMSYKLSDMFGLAHGHAVALCLPYVWEHLLESQQDENIKNALDDLMQGIPSKKYEDTLGTITELWGKLNIYCEFDCNDSVINELAASVNVQRLSNHPVKLSFENLYQIYEKMLEAGINQRTTE